MRPVDTRDYRPDIDGLRALAVLGVVAYHAFPSSLSGGYVGVDVFFVISGFLITSIILRGVEAGRFSFVEFYGRRVRRIFPALLIVLAACFIAGWFILWTTEFKLLGKHILGAGGFVSNFVLWKESGYFDARSESKPLLHLWSLGIEEQFYLVWPLLVWSAYRLRRRVVPLVTVLLAASFALSLWWVKRDPAAAFFLPYPRFWELMAGCALAYATLHGRVNVTARAAHVASLAGLAMILGAMIALTPASTFPGWRAVPPVLGAVLVIAAGRQAAPNRVVLSRPGLVLLGLISYPLYLWHWPILTFLRLSMPDDPSTALRVGAVALSVALAWLTYRLLELPIHAANIRRVAPALCGAMACVALAAFAVRAAGGLPQRFPPLVASLEEYALFSDEVSNEWRRHRCMIERGERAFAAECVDSLPAGAPLAVLWGDSHGAALYPGLRAQAGTEYRLAQLTLSACPPMLDYEDERVAARVPQCVGLNRQTLGRITALKPDVVFLAAWWQIYQPALLARTIDSLRSVGVRRVVVVGDVPVWKQNVRRSLGQLVRRRREIPLRVEERYFRLPRRSDARIAGIAREHGAEFVSLLDGLCDGSTCMAFTPAGMAYVDNDHLAPPASRLLAARLFAPYLGGESRATALR